MTTPTLPPSHSGPAKSKITLLGVAALAACALAAGLAISALYSAASALFVPSARALVSAQDEKATAAATAFAKSIDDNAAQFNGRSVFFVPSAPPPPPPPPPPPRDPEPETPPPPSTPSSYGGPALLGMLSDTIWFTNGKKLKIGESDADSGTKLISVDAPWSAQIEYKGVAFKVPLFTRDDIVIKKEEPPKPAAADETKSQETKAEDSEPKTERPSSPPESSPTPSPATPPATEPKEPTPPPAQPAPTPPEPK